MKETDRDRERQPDRKRDRKRKNVYVYFFIPGQKDQHSINGSLEPHLSLQKDWKANTMTESP